MIKGGILLESLKLSAIINPFSLATLLFLGMFYLGIRKKIIRHLEMLQVQATDLENLLARGTYIRHSEKVASIQRAQKTLQETELPFGAFLFFPQKSKQFRELQEFLKTIETRLEKTDGDFVTKEIERFAFFFDSIESKPLTETQRQACVINDDRNLVFAGAGTGKTSTIIGRTGYLLASKQCSPEEILLLAFGKEASEEMRERQEERLRKWLRLENNALPTIETFHALGNKIVGKACGRRYDITPFAEGDHRLLNFIEKTIRDLCRKDEAFCEEIISYYRGGRVFVNPKGTPLDSRKGTYPLG